MIGGGACAYNPEPLAEFFDMFYIGEGETVYDALFDAYKANKAAGGSRLPVKAAQIPGNLCSIFIQCNLQRRRHHCFFTPAKEGVPEKV